MRKRVPDARVPRPPNECVEQLAIRPQDPERLKAVHRFHQEALAGVLRDLPTNGDAVALEEL